MCFITIRIPTAEVEAEADRCRMLDPVFAYRVAQQKRRLQEALERIERERRFALLHEATGVMQGQSADAIADTDALYDD